MPVKTFPDGHGKSIQDRSRNIQAAPAARILVGVALLAGIPADALNLKKWVGGQGSGPNIDNWTITNNWNPTGAPTSTDSVVFDGTTSRDAKFNNDAATCGALVFTTGYTNTVDWGGASFDYNILTIADYRSGGTFINTGIHHFTGTSAQTLIPHPTDTLPAIDINGTGGVTITTNRLLTPTLTFANLASNGGLNLGAGLNDTVLTTLTFNGAGSNGILNFGSATLWYGGTTANFTGLATLTAGTGTLNLYAASGTQTLTPKASTTHPGITHSGAGTLTLATNTLQCLSFSNSAGIVNFNGQNITTVSGGNFTVTNGTTSTFSNLAGRTITVDGNASLNGQNGNLLNLNPGGAWTLTATASSTVAATYATITQGTVNPSSITGSTTNCTDGGSNVRWAFLNTRTWDGGGGASDYNWSTAANWSDNTLPNTLSQVVFDGTSTKKCVLDAAATVYSIQFTSAYSSTDANTGKFEFSSNTLTVESANADFTMGSGASIVAGTGNLTFSATSGTQTFTPRSGATYPAITKAGAGTVTVATNALTAGALAVNGGTWNWGSSTLTHAVSSLATSGSPTLVFGTNTMQVTTGNADFSGLGTLTANTGTLAFTSSSGTQILTPKASATHPNVTHTGAGTLQLATNSLSCLSFNQSAGVLDFNGRDLTTTGTGNFTISNGTTSSISNLGGRTITVGGNASLDGQSGNLLNLNPGTAWTLAATASSSVTGTFATVANSTVNPSTITGTMTNGINGGGNTRWTFINTIVWDGGGSDGTCGGGAGDGNKWSCAANWDGNVAPTSTDLVIFNGTSTKNAKLDANVSLSTITFASAYTGTFDFQSYTLTVTGDADFRSGGAFTPGTGKVTFTGSAVQIFRPPGEAANTTLPTIEQNGSGGATVTTNRLRTSSLIMTSGTFNLGSGLTDTVTTSLTSAGGGLDFGSSTLVLEATTANFSGLTTLTAGSGTLSFNATSGTQTFTPKSGATFPPITKANAGTVTVATNGLTSGGALTVTGGTWNWGSSTLTHSVTAFSFSNTPTMTFGSNTVQVTSGNAAMSGLGTLNANTGTLAFTAASGTQVLTPKSATGHPHISHSGAGTLQLATNDLSTLSFTQTAGTLDFNGRNITTTSSGNFTVSNGSSASFANLGGRTLTVAGNAAFSGITSSYANLNPGSTWTINATGTLSASYALIGNSNASGSAAAGQASNCENMGSNTNWNFLISTYAGWAYSTKIAFNTTSTGANVSGNVANFPLLVRLDSNNFNFNQAHPSGNDIRFADPDGTTLSYAIERWSYTSKRAEVWVKIPQIDGNSALDYISMYWGNNSASSLANSAAVFGGSDNFRGVWHLAEDGNTSADGYPDASSNSLNGTGSGLTSSSDVDAVAGRGQTFDGTSTRITTGTNATLGNVTSSFTISMWVRPTAASGRMWAASRSTTSNGFGLGLSSWEMQGTTFGVKDYITTGHALSQGSWYHLAMVVDASFDASFYLNGVFQETITHTVAGNANTDDGYVIGANQAVGGAFNEYFKGTLDEVRVESAIRSLDWIKLCYETQKVNSTAVTYPNTALSTFAYSTKVHINTTSNGAATMSDVSNFPLLIRLTSANFNFAQAKSDGGDIRFADSAGNLLAYDLERFDAAAKAAEIWVLVPTVKGNNNSQWFRMYWGKGTATTLSSGASVFPASGGNLGVWHMHSVASFSDATGTASAGTNSGAADAAGMIGLASHFDADADKISVPAYSATEASSFLVDPNAYAVFSFWVKAADDWNSATNRRVIFTKGRNSGGSDDQDWAIFMNSSDDKVTLETRNTGSAWTGMTTNNTAWDAGVWYQLTVVNNIAGKSYQWYINGVPDGASQTYANSHAELGDSPNIEFGEHLTDAWFQGYLDEVRIANAARSADWIKLNYETQKSGSAVVQVGARTPEYAVSVRLNFNTTSTGANVSGNVANIPILVRLNSTTLDFSKTQAGGSDLQFVDKGGAYLYHEVVEWDKGNRTGKVWVNVPQVDGNSLTDYVTLYYGCSACTGTPYAVSDSVWGAYVGAWHLNTSNENQAKDASAKKHHLNYTNAVPFATGITAPLAPYFNSNDARIADPASGDLDLGTGNFTFMAWIKTTQAAQASVWPVLAGKMNPAAAPRYGYGLVMDQAGANGGKYAFELWSNGTQKQTPFSSSVVNDGNWHFLVGKRSGTTLESYVDGVSQGTTAASGIDPSDGVDFAIGWGADQNASNLFQGYINEVSLAKSAFSADYIKLSYMNQKATDALLSTPLTTASFTSSKVFKFNTTASGADVPGDVYNFPLLLRIVGSSILDAVQSGAPDIRFLDADGVTWLDYQIERWDNGTKDSAEVWVKVPKVDGNSTSDFITMYYDDVTNGAVPDGQCATCVFDGSPIKAVYHMNDNAATPVVSDSRSLSNGTLKRSGANRNTSNNVGSGYIGASSLTFSGTDEFVDLGGSITMVQNVAGATLSAWVQTSNTNSNKRNIVYFSNATDVGQSRTKLGLWTSNYTMGGGRALDAESVVEIAGNSNALAINTWYHLAAVMDYAADSVKLFVNGVRSNSLSTAGFDARTTSNTASIGATIGALGGGTAEEFAGLIDEVQILSASMDANWVKLSYQTQRRDAALLFNPSPADFNASQKYRFNTTRTGANVAADVDNFPLLVRISGATIVDAVQNDWDDIRFLDGDGKTWLQYEVERWDKTLDSAEVWVLIPRVDGNSDNDFITLYYDDASNGAVASGQCPNCVFSTSNGFTGVWHLNASMSDATSNGYSGTDASTSDAAAIIGRGRSFNGSSNHIRVNPAAGSGASLTFSTWIKATNATGYQRIVGKQNGSGSLGWSILLRPTAEDTAMHFRVGSEGTYGGWPDPVKQTKMYNPGLWDHIVVTYNGSTNTGTIYRNGVFKDDATNGDGRSPANTADSLYLGRNDVEYFLGTLDEPRVANVARSADWIKLEYETQRYDGNLFWNARPGPNNKAVLTATANTRNISLSWPSSVTDSANADSVGIWVKYSGAPDSVGASGQTKVVTLPKADTTYTYPALYPNTYYFALAVRNAAGQWSPFTAGSTDTATLSLAFSMPDTIYVDSAIGNDANSCTAARNPATPKLTIEAADNNCDAGANDTLVIRVMPGTYTGAGNDQIDSDSKPVILTSFDNNSRAIFSSATGSLGYTPGTLWVTLDVFGGVHLRNLDLMAGKSGVTTGTGVFTRNESDITIEGCRIYNNGSTQYAYGIILAENSNNFHVANNIIHEPTLYGIWADKDNDFNIVNNTLIGSGAAGTKGIYMGVAAYAADMTFANNILYNWDYGIHTVSNTASTGVVSNNLFHMVTSGREMTGSTDANMVVKDPLLFSNHVRSTHAFKLLPGSPAIDAGTTAAGSGFARTTPADLWGSARPQGSAPDIGAYEGTGHTPNPSASFDTLTNTVSGNTVIVKNSKWKLVWDMARGGGITGFYDMTGDTTANLVGTGSLLFDVRIDSHLASEKTANTIAPGFLERTRARSVVRQRLALSASLDLNIRYTVHASGHVFIQSEIANLTSGTQDLDVVQYNLKLGAATAATLSASNLAGISYRNGYGWLTAATKDALLAATEDLDGNGYFTETWSQAGATAGSLDSAGFRTDDLADLASYMKRHHHFLLYVGDNALDAGKVAALNADAYTPSPVTASAGSLLHERSWQDQVGGHWPFDDGAGTVAKDMSINYANNGTLTSATWVSGKVNGALRFTTSSVVTVADADPLEAGQNRGVMAWVKPDFSAMGADAYVLSKGLTTASGWHFRRVSGANRIKFVVGSVEVQSPVLVSGEWVHLAGGMDGAGIPALYVNGVLVGAGGSVATYAANSDAMLFGKDGGGANAFAGDIDDVRFYLAFPGVGQIQAIVNRGFSAQYGNYHLRADNNNRVVALFNETTAQTRIQPAFRIDNWYGIKTPKYVYLNGTRLVPNSDFVVDSIVHAGEGAFGNALVLQVNKVLTGTNQVLFVDDNDSSGYMGEAAKMKGLTMSATANDKIAIQNFSGSTFGAAASGQWALELDLNGWTTNTVVRVTDSGFGEFNSWKAAAVSPNLAVASATQLVGQHSEAGKSLAGMKFDNTSAVASMYSAGRGYAGPANISYTLVDSSATRLSLTLATMTITGEGTLTLDKRWTVYPTGRIFGSFVIATSDLSLDGGVRVHFQGRYNSGPTTAWTDATAVATGRQGLLGGDLDYHSLAGATLGIKSGGTAYTAPADMMASSTTFSDNASGADIFHTRLNLATNKFESTDDPITVNFAMDISRDFTDSATADSLMKDLQTPASITAVAGTAVTNDALDLNADGFAEGDGAYTFTASGSGIAHFRFVNTVPHFNPVFRIKSWTFATLPEFVAVDNQTLTLGYHYNAYVNTASNELVLQLNRTLNPATHVFYFSHKTGLAVTLNRFEAVGGDGADTLKWATESEFENLGFNLWRRVAPGLEGVDGALASGGPIAGAGIANALREELRQRAAAKLAADSSDTIPRLDLSPEEIKAQGWVRINARLIPGARGGSSATTSEYLWVDRTVAYGSAYEYLLEAVDFSGARAQYGPRTARPTNPLETALEPNYPNPFNPVTTLRFTLKEKARVSLVIFDARGRLVRTLIRPGKPMAAGRYRLLWDARDDKGFEVPSGQYFYRFTAPKYVKTRKMLLVK